MPSQSGFSFVASFSEHGHQLSRSQKLHRENERKNLMTITRMVLRAFLEQTMVDSNRLVECDTQHISDLLIMLEKVLWHGFKVSRQKALIALKSPDAEMWTAIERIASTNSTMYETANCVAQIESLLTPISRLRAFLRLAMMQKKLFDFFTIIINSPLLRNLYEDWALLRQEDIVQLTGSLLGLSVVDCNLELGYDYLQDQPLSIDLSLYIRIPTLPTGNEEILMENESKRFDKEKKILLDQNNYLEERNRQLQCNVENLKRRLSAIDYGDHSKALTVERELVSFKNIDCVDYDKPVSPCANEWEIERERLLGQIVEREDSLRIVQQQLVDTRKVNVDLYDKLKLADEKSRRVEKDFLNYQQQHLQECETLKRTISHLEVSNNILQENSLKKNTDQEVIRAELEKKYGQYAELVDALQKKQNALSQAENEVLILQRKVDSLEKELKEVPFMKEEIGRLQGKLEYVSERANESERALEELAGHLSESKLRMLELTEELLPFTDAHWTNDADIIQCTACSERFSISKRKHHCRLVL
ncbi:RUN domain protein [Dictyocaulus viviparus]|uniref:RUN domain protein n=1 Tax=Dictyocaulus viviparus TaxID=29172 RepID=A0A0D8XTS4_DICVI|nr:RUN domain protein [Dictyocaulus viviparus]